MEKISNTELQAPKPINYLEFPAMLYPNKKIFM